MMMQKDQPGDYVLATGESHSVREFIELAFSHIDRTIEWRGEGVDEEGIDAENGDVLIRVDPRYYRPTEVEELLGDPTKAHTELGWRHRTSFTELVREMMNHDISVDDNKRRRHDD